MQILRLVKLARGHHTHHSPFIAQRGGGMCHWSYPHPCICVSIFVSTCTAIHGVCVLYKHKWPRVPVMFWCLMHALCKGTKPTTRGKCGLGGCQAHAFFRFMAVACLVV